MKLLNLKFPVLGLLALGIAVGCGKAEELHNEFRVQGHWLMTQAEHANAVERAIANESVVLTFNGEQVAFSKTDSLQGEAVYNTLPECQRGPRPYRAEGNQMVLPAIAACPETRLNIQQVDANTLKFQDPENTDITRVFTRIDDNKYFELVKQSDRSL